MTTKKTLLLTVGLPRSGKSTWVRQQPFPMVNPDSIRLAIHGQRFVLSAEAFVWAVVETMVRALFLAGHNAVVLDATNVTRKRRDRWTSSEWETRFKVFNASVDTCIARATMQPDYGMEIIPIIERMAKEWEPLAADELLLEERS